MVSGVRQKRKQEEAWAATGCQSTVSSILDAYASMLALREPFFLCPLCVRSKVRKPFWCDAVSCMSVTGRKPDALRCSIPRLLAAASWHAHSCSAPGKQGCPFPGLAAGCSLAGSPLAADHQLQLSSRFCPLSFCQSWLPVFPQSSDLLLHVPRASVQFRWIAGGAVGIGLIFVLAFQCVISEPR